MAFDPTFPLFPIACIMGRIMMFLVLLTSFVRQSWNLGVAFLCFWLMLELATSSAALIIWSDSGDIKYYAFCDIYSRVQLVTSVVKPMSTLLILRRLYLIVSMGTVEMPGLRERRLDIVIEWTLGFILPILVAGPIYYTVQASRFVVYEGFGCTNNYDDGILGLLLLASWTIVCPLLSLTIYYPRVSRTFYRQSRAFNEVLRRSNDSISHTNYQRILMIASLDVVLTLPVGAVSFALSVIHDGIKRDGSRRMYIFYSGWSELHENWEPTSVSYPQVLETGALSVAWFYLSPWISPVLAFAIFSLFGWTPDARATYWRILCQVTGWFGWTPTPRRRKSHPPLGSIAFGEPPHGISIGTIGSHPSFIDTPPEAQRQHERNNELAATVHSEAEKAETTEECASGSVVDAELGLHAKEARSTAAQSII